MGDSQYEKLDGNADLVRSKGEAYQSVAEAIEGALSALDSIVSDTATTAKSMDKTRQLAEDVRDDIKKATGRYRVTGDALVAYAPTLDSSISSSETAATRIAEIHQDLWDAQLAKNAAENEADGLPDSATPADKTTANTAASTAATRVETLQSELTYWRGQWQEAKDAKDGSARTAKNAIDEQFERDEKSDLHDSGWDKFKDFVSQVYKVFKVICDIAGILAIFLSWVPILGQVLVALAAIGAILAIVEGVVKLATEGFSWAAVAGIALGVVSLFGGKIATHLGKLVTAKTVLSTSQTAARVAGASDDGAKLVDDAIRFTTELPVSRMDKLKYAFKSPFVQSTSQTAVREAFESGALTKTEALVSTLKNSLPTTFNLKGTVGGDAATLATRLSDMGADAIRLEGPVRAAQIMSTTAFTSSVANAGMNATNSFINGDVTGGIKNTIGVGGSFLGGSWGGAVNSPLTIINDIKTLGTVDVPEIGTLGS